MDIKQISKIMAVVFLLIGIIFFHSDMAILANFLIISLLMGLLPSLILTYLKYERIKDIENEFPNFLRDMSEAQKSGTSLADAFRNAAKTNYGRLTPEIRKMSNQLSWGIPLQSVLEKFSERMKDSDIIKRSVRIIIEAYNSGGDIAETMESTAMNVTTIKEAEKERKSMMSQHVVMMYILFFAFVGITIVISKTLTPMMNMNLGANMLGGTIGSFKSPCISCQGSSNMLCISCSVFSGVSTVFGLGTSTNSYYRAIFLSMIIIQGIFTGLVSGQIGENSPKAGIKHSLIMTTIGFGIFMISLRLGFI